MAGRIVGSFDDLIANLTQTLGHAAKTVNDGMEEVMAAVQKEAKHRVPLEFGNMEDAIKLENMGYRKSWTVYVDESMPDDTGKYTVGDYMLFLHEGIPPYNLGPASQAKNYDGKVGSKFLEGSFNDIVQNGDVMFRLQAKLDAAISKRGFL